jgi:hypothetical protein
VLTARGALEELPDDTGVFRIVARYPVASGFLISGGWLSYRLLQEAKECFVHGQYLATAILGVAFVERIFAAELYAAGRDDLERSGGLDLLREALASGRLSLDEFQRFDRMRRLRNLLAHFRRPLASGTVEAHAVQQGSHPDRILAADAEAILEGALAVLQRSAV